MDDLEQLVIRAGTGPADSRQRAFAELVPRFQDTVYAWACERSGFRPRLVMPILEMKMPG